MFGFSRGALYAFNYAMFYPESVSHVYLDAPVLNVKSWPISGSIEQAQLFEEYNVNEETFKTFKDSPIDHLEEFAKHKLPVLLVVGCKDTLVPFAENGQIMMDYYNALQYEDPNIHH